MKPYRIALVLVLFSTSCSRNDSRPNLVVIDTIGSLEETQVFALNRLVQLMDERPSETYYEVFSNRRNGYGFLVNYNRELRLLSIEEDFCSGWTVQYGKVERAELGQIVAQKLTFAQLSTLLTPTKPGQLIPKYSCN